MDPAAAVSAEDVADLKPPAPKAKPKAVAKGTKRKDKAEQSAEAVAAKKAASDKRQELADANVLAIRKLASTLPDLQPPAGFTNKPLASTSADDVSY